MRQKLCAIVIVVAAGCHDGATRGANQSEIEHPMAGAWEMADRPGRVFFHKTSYALDDGDLGVFPLATVEWARDGDDGLVVIGRTKETPPRDASLVVSFRFETSNEVTLTWQSDDAGVPGSPTTLIRAPYLVVDDPGSDAQLNK